MAGRVRLFLLIVVPVLAFATHFAYRSINAQWIEFQAGERYFFDGNFTAAIPFYVSALEKGLRDERVYLRLGDSYLATEQFRDAVTLYEEMLQKLPPHPKAVQKLARLYDQLSGADRAIALYQQYQSDVEFDAEGSWHLAELYKRKGEFALSEPLFLRVIQSKPAFYAAKLSFAEMLAWMKRYRDSINLYAAVRSSTTPDRLVTLNYGRTLLWSGDYGRACDALSEAISLPESKKGDLGLEVFVRKTPTSQIRWELARCFSLSGKLELALETYAALLKSEPQLYEAAVEMATVYSRRGEREQALKIISEIPADSARDKVSVFLAEHFAVLGDYARAESLYREYLARFPKDSEVRMKLADTLGWSKNFDAARVEYRRVLDGKPPEWIARTVDEKILLLLADAHAEREEFDQSRTLYELYAGMYPEDQIARAAFARMLVKSGDYSKALGLFDQILAQQPTNYAVAEEKAFVLGLHKEFRKAVQLFRDLENEQHLSQTGIRQYAQVLYWMGQNDESLQKLSLIPDDALDRAGRLLRAELALAFGDKKDALERFRGYLATDPQDHQARFKYAELLSWEKRFNESLAEYSVVVAARPNDVALRRKYAQALSWAGKAEQSIKEFATASEIEKKIGRPDKDGGTSS